MRTSNLLHAALAAAVLVAASATAAADELLVGSPNSAILSGSPFKSEFQVVGACGGAVASFALDGDVAWIGDESGIIYRRDLVTGAISYAFNAPNDALGLAMHDGDLLCAGGATVARIDVTTGAVLATYAAPADVTSLFVRDDDVFVGTTVGLTFRANANVGDFRFVGTCSGPISSIVVDGDHLFLGSSDGSLYCQNMDTLNVDWFFHIGGDLGALASHGADLLVGSSDTRILRVDKESGAIKGVIDGMFPVAALGVIPSAAVGGSYCYASGCPCGNDGGDGGCLNSTGFGARLVGSGSGSVAADNLRIDAFQIPRFRAARFYMAKALVQTPLGDGLLCAGSGGYGLFRFPTQDSGAEGAVRLEPGLVAFAAANLPPAAQVFAGATWNFQVWFRDAAGPCGSGVNTSNALSVDFTP